MSRVGSFPLNTAYNTLRRYGNNPQITFDPFCGKGTTLLAARLVGSRAYGIDVAPEAIICTMSKLVSVTFEDTAHYLNNIRIGRPSLKNVPEDVRLFFHEQTLEQLISIKNTLEYSRSYGTAKEQQTAVLILAALLGILHGHASYSLSISSAHAFAMAPRYVKQYSLAHGLEPPLRDVRDCLLRKLQRCFAKTLPPPVAGCAVRGQAEDALLLFPKIKGRVDCILTSPPYLASHTYAKDNWLRHWLLGFNYRDLGKEYLQTGSITKYKESMAKVLSNVARLLRRDGRLILIIGQGRNGTHNHQPRTTDMSEVFGELLESTTGLRNIRHVSTHLVESHKRYYHALSATNGHHRNVRKEHLFLATKC